MQKKPIRTAIIEKGDARFLLKDARFLLKEFDGREERTPIVRQPRKPPRYMYWKVTLDKSRKTGF